MDTGSSLRSPPSLADRQLVLFVRSLAPAGAGGAPRTTIDRLEQLDATDRIAGYDVQVWGSEVCPETAAHTDVGATILNRVAAFQAWAREHDRTLAAGFKTRTVTSQVTGETRTRIRFPVMTLAEYYDDDLVHVAPSRDGEAVRTVADRLALFESTDRAAVQAAAGPATLADGTGDHEMSSDD